MYVITEGRPIEEGYFGYFETAQEAMTWGYTNCISFKDGTPRAFTVEWVKPWHELERISMLDDHIDKEDKSS